MVSPTPQALTLAPSFLNTIKPMFEGNFSPSQYQGLGYIAYATTTLSRDQRAYVFATVHHETGRRMQPIPEINGARARYAPYYGRGLVQLTWNYNYARWDKLYGTSLLKNPSLALEWPTALDILVKGMMTGFFTGRKLSDYFYTKPSSAGLVYQSNPVAARAIINGTDEDELISVYWSVYRNAFKLGWPNLN